MRTQYAIQSAGTGIGIGNGSGPAYKLEKNRSGYFEARWSERQPDGKYRSKSWSTGHTDRASARIAAEAYFRSVNAISGVAAAKTVGDIVELYIVAAEGRGVDPKQASALRLMMTAFGVYTPAEIDAAVLLTYIKTQRSRGLKDGSIRRYLKGLNAALSWGVRNKLLALADLPHIDMPPESPPRKVFLLEADETALYALALADTAPGERLTRVSRFVALALDTAARTEAIEQLEWTRVDFAQGVIDFDVPGRSIKKKRRAQVPISSRLRPVLERAYRERTGPFVLDSDAEIKAAWRVFIMGTPYGAKGIGKHDLRRTWATLAARAGVDLWEIAGVLGDTMATVVKNYAVHQPEHLKGAMEKKLRGLGVPGA